MLEAFTSVTAYGAARIAEVAEDKFVEFEPTPLEAVTSVLRNLPTSSILKV